MNILTFMFPLNPKCLKVLCQKHAKHPNYLTSDCKSQLTVLACTSVSWFSLPPFVMFDHKTLNSEFAVGELPSTLYGLSSKSMD